MTCACFSGWRSEPFPSLDSHGWGHAAHPVPIRPPAVGAPGASLGQQRDRGAPALCLPTHTRGGGISTGLMVIYNGKPPLSPDIVLPDRGKKEGTKSPLIISNDEATAPASSPVPSTATKCSIVIRYIFLKKPSAVHKASAISLTGSSSLSA